MPKINIHDEHTDGFRMEVGWAHDKYVQVATTNQHSTLRLPEGDDPEATEPFYGWHVTLDRAGINRAIRALREARDEAFGRDA